MKLLSTFFTVFFPMITVFVLHLVGGFFGMYDWLPEIDNVLHFLGGVATAITVLLAQRWGDATQVIPLIRGSFRALLGVGLVVLVAVLWELLEFTLDQIVPGARFQDGLLDTMIDLVMGLLGAMTVFSVHVVREER